MATLAQFRTRISAKLGLDTTAAGAEETLVTSWVNEAVVEILLRTHCTVEKADMATTAAVWQYQLDDDILVMRDVWREDTDGSIEPMMRVSEQEILDYHRTNTTANAAYVRYATVGSNLLLIWPAPSAAYDIHLLYVPRPVALSAAGDDPSGATTGRIPKEFHKAIEYYALWQGAEFDENRPSQSGERYRALYEAYLGQVIRPAMRKKGGIDMPQVRRKAWRPGRFAFRENDRYPLR